MQRGDSMDGLLLLDKPTGMSSHDCVAFCRKRLKTKKVGHAGTLDVEASGVLVLGIGKGTRILRYLTADTKAYRFGITFNLTTDTLDHTGETTERKECDDFSSLHEMMRSFEGEYLQTPPAYSAVKVKGKKLYEYARKGEAVPDVPARKIRVGTFSQVGALETDNGLYRGDFFVEGSKGLFVRKLAADLARKIGTVAHTHYIRRERAGRFPIEECHSLEMLEKGDFTLVGLADALAHMPKIEGEPYKDRIQNGQFLPVEVEAPRVRLVDAEGVLLAIYKKIPDGIRPETVLMQGE